MLEARSLVARSGTNLFGECVYFVEQPRRIDSASHGLHVIQSQHRLRQEVYRGLATPTLKAQMHGRRDAIQRACQILQFRIDPGQRLFEQFGGIEVFAAIERGDRVIQ